MAPLIVAMTTAGAEILVREEWTVLPFAARTDEVIE